MKQLFLCLVILFAPMNVFALEPSAAPSEQKQEESTNPYDSSVILKMHQDALDAYKTQLESIDKLDFYKNWVALDTNTKKSVSVEDLTPTEQQGFYVYQAEVLYNCTSIALIQWTHYYEAFLKRYETALQEKIDENDPAKEVKQKQLKYYKELDEGMKPIIDELAIVRTKVHGKHIELINQMIAGNKKDKKLVAELNSYLRQVKESHISKEKVENK